MKFDIHILLITVYISYPIILQFKPAIKPYVGLVMPSTVAVKFPRTLEILVFTAGKSVPVTVLMLPLAVVHLLFIDGKFTVG